MLLQPSRSACGVLSAATTCAGGAAVIIAGTALAVAASGLADDARRLLRFGFGGVEHTSAEVSKIALHNARLAAGTLLATVARPRVSQGTQRVLDLVMATLFACNAGAVGIALAAYGTRIGAAIAFHLPLELIALSLAGGAYMQARKQALSLPAIGAIALFSALVLVAAAWLETYASLGGIR